MVSQVDGDASHSAERLEYFINFAGFETLGKVTGNGFWNDAKPAFLIEHDALLELLKEEVPPGKVLGDFA